MSTIIMSTCWPLKMPPTAKSVLISLADNANDHGHCWPSLSKICERTCFGRTAVIEAIKWLEEAGAIRADRSDRYRTTYVITPSSFSAGELVHEANQSGRRTSSNDGALVRLADNEVRKPDDEVRQTDTNRQEPSITVIKSNPKKRTKAPSAEFDFSSWPAAPCPSILADWLKVRKAKRAPLTDTAIRSLAPHLHEAVELGFTVDECLTKAVTQGWQGFEASWITKKPEGKTNANDRSGRRESVAERAARFAEEGDEREFQEQQLWLTKA